ncbi:LAGLIDADG family homing endonuclease [Halalkaliarchaeum desulfuricum]|nr:LAGLIDADG family homing endonuclease [Halalkaliarchaeum desulfuricum]
MATAGTDELTERFIQFYRNYYRDEIGQLAQRYPNEQRSLYVDYDDLYTFDPDLAEDYLAKPEQFREYAEEALRLYDLPADVSLGQAHVRVENLPRSKTIDIRGIRVQDDHIGRMIAVQGIVRKATDVRPKVTEAAFECQRCGTMTYIPQSESGFQEPHECQGCERQGPFRVNHDQSEFIDSQKLRVQESPEGLRGGQTPQAIDVDIVDDITGKVTPGDHVTVVGVLHIEQMTDGNEKTPVFDLYMDGVSISIEDEEFEDMDITQEDVQDIIERSSEEDIYQQMVDSVAPSIYGFEEEKLAMILQLFSGVTKHLPDGSRIRGDLHMLLIGDPGTGKSQLLSYIQNIAPRSVYTSGKGSSSAGLCVTGDTKIHTAEGFMPIRELAEEHHPDPVDEDTAAESDHEVYSFDRESGEMELRESSHVWRMPEKPCRRIETAHGKELEASVNTPVLVCGERGIEWREISDIKSGDHVAVPKYKEVNKHSPPVRDFIEFTQEKVKPTEESITFLRQQLFERFGTLREAAAALDLSEDFIYDSLANRYLPLDKLDRILEAIDADLEDIEIDRAMLRHGHDIRIPDRFDEDLMYLIGLVFGDGDVSVSSRGENRGHVRISNSDEELLRKAAECIKSTFDRSVEIEYQENRVPCIRFHSVTVARFFSNLGVESPKTDIGLEPRLMTAEHADAFLQGLFDADGCVSARRQGGSSIQFSTIDDEFARQIQRMLESYGIRARRRERDRRGTTVLKNGYEIESKSIQTHLTIYGKDIDVFAEQIGFNSTKKEAALKTIVEDTTRRGERLPIGKTLIKTDGAGGDYYQNIIRGNNPSRERTNNILAERDLGDYRPFVEEVAEASLVWDKVVSAVDTGEKEVFDLTVPETHNFVGNGIVTHNTAAAVRDDFGDGQQWTLEAGALVLADKGIAAVDELDKMRCVTGETLVSVGDGSVRQIGELAREAKSSGEIEQLQNGQTIRDVDFTVWTMAEDGNLVKRPVTAIHAYHAPESLCKVTLQTGEQLTATQDHPFFVLEGGERKTRAASDLEKDDWVYVPRTIPTPACDGGPITAEIDTNSKPQTQVNHQYSDPQEAKAAILGYLSGDGNIVYDRSGGCYGIRFTNSEEELLRDFESACLTAFGSDPVRHESEQREDGVETVRLHGRRYADSVLEAGMNLENYDGKAFPTWVTEGSTREKKAFVRALVDSEGSVDTQTGNVRVYSSSREILCGTRILLLQFGITSQLRTRERKEKRDLHVLTITDADSLNRFARHIGFTLTRKQNALMDVLEIVDGDRTILNVVPEIGDYLQEIRGNLRLHQSECGINKGTYCDFESGKANVSIQRAKTILATFKRRKERAETDQEVLDREPTWSVLTTLKGRYHVSQSELAIGTPFSQQKISRLWGDDEVLRETIVERFKSILREIATVDLSTLSVLIKGDVKWRKVESTEVVSANSSSDRIPIYREQLADMLGCSVDLAESNARKLLKNDIEIGNDWKSLRKELQRHQISFAELSDGLDVSASTVSRWFTGVVDTDRFEEVQNVAVRQIKQFRERIRATLDEMNSYATPRVYDLTVEGTHNFVANGMIVHNSEDRSAMHQALEQQKISISKAGINATLKSRCSLLGAANPKYGRFDQYEPLGEQIDLEPALISRFDLIFTVTDQPDPDHDARLADHILTTNYAGEMNTQRERLATSEFTESEVEQATQEVEPVLDAELLRKYIAYAKRNCFPTMTDEAREAIRDFYVDLRAQGADEDDPVPVTARKLEALVRLSEASARVRLSDTVDHEDAQRVIDIVESSLQDIGVDPETGQFDADVIETGTSKSQRDRIKNLKGLIEELEDEFEEGAPIDEVLERADDVGMDPTKAEDEIEKLRRKGEVYEPRQNHLRTT